MVSALAGRLQSRLALMRPPLGGPQLRAQGSLGSAFAHDRVLLYGIEVLASECECKTPQYV